MAKLPEGVRTSGATASSSGLANGLSRVLDFRVEFRDIPVGVTGPEAECAATDWIEGPAWSTRDVRRLSRSGGRNPSAMRSKSSTSNPSSKMFTPSRVGVASSSNNDRLSVMMAGGRSAAAQPPPCHAVNKVSFPEHRQCLPATLQDETFVDGKNIKRVNRSCVRIVVGNGYGKKKEW